MSGRNKPAMRSVHTILIVASVVAGVLTACSPDSKHKILTFFLDGVPEPGVTPVVGYAPPAARRGPVRSGPGIERGVSSTARPVFAHPPYRDNRCGACHSRETGQLFQSPREGLCQTCHAGIPNESRFAHAPAAVGDCLFCHHHHSSAYEKVLLDEPAKLCLNCHDIDDLTEGTHAGDAGERSCVECHDPHGGADRFFLKRTER